jgi:hypothetical protein
MKKEYCLISLCLIVFGFSCKKNDNVTLMEQISGKWELGPVKNHLFISSIGRDTVEIYPNRNGDYIDFKNNDTAYYTFTTMNATGKSPYKVPDNKTLIIYLDTFQVLSIDSKIFNIYKKTGNAQSYFEQWITYVR